MSAAATVPKEINTKFRFVCVQIEYPDESFDVVVAANVIHLLDEPHAGSLGKFQQLKISSFINTAIPRN